MSLKTNIEYLRRVNSEALQIALSSVEAPTEASIAEAWLKTLQTNSDLYPFGWYDPPPNGIVVLIGNPSEFQRLKFKSLREPNQLPKESIRLDNHSLIYAYASPIHRSSLLIGDICLTLYKGGNTSIQAHLRQTYEITSAIANYAQVGMSIKDLFLYASKIIRETGLSNETFSVTDRCSFDIGHTIPWSDNSPLVTEQKTLMSADEATLKKTISNKRMFLNAENTLSIPDTIAFSIEPRLSGNSLPPVSFHLTVVFENGHKSIIAGYEPILIKFGMDKYLPLSPNGQPSSS